MAYTHRPARVRSRAMLLTGVLHALVFAAVLHRSREGTGRVDIRQGAAPATWIAQLEADAPEPPPASLLSEEAVAPLDEAATDAALNALAAPQVDLPAIPSMAAADESAGDAPPAEIRYMGEVTARIQREWRVPVAAREQHCVVHIELDTHGEVRALTLQACDAEPSLQASIEQAIRRAAPLPARVKGEALPGELTLEFAAFAAATEGRRSSVQPVAAL